MIFEKMKDFNYEQVVFCSDEESGLKAIIAIHDTTLGPASGGCRMWPYETEEEALIDVLRLSKGMTYKNAAAGLDMGGGKTVIIGDPKKDKSEELFRALGRYVEAMNGRYITGEDVNTTVEDMAYMFKETNYAKGRKMSEGSSGDPGPKTAIGVHAAMKRTALEAFGSDSLKDKKIMLQGFGSVAYSLAEMLHEEGAKLLVADVKQEVVDRAVKEFNAEPINVEDVYDVEADILSPCALGGILNDETIPKLKVKAVCGSANNQLLDIEKHGEMIAHKGIVYAPDYVVNAGGAINIALELGDYNEEKAIEQIKNIYVQMGKVYDIAREEGITSAKAADRLAEKRIASVKNLRSNFIPTEKSSLSN